MKRRIAILMPALQAGGTERFVSNFITRLNEEFEIHLVLFDRVLEYQLPDAQIVKILDGNSLKGSNFLNILKIPILAVRFKRYCDHHDISLAISYLNRPNFVACVARKIGLKARLIINERTYTPVYYSDKKLSGKIGNFLVSKLYPLADHILSNSKRINYALMHHYGVPNRYGVIENIIDLEQVSHQKQLPVEDISFEPFTFVTVANLKEGKNHEMLISAFHAMNRADCQLVVIGKGRLREKLENMVLNLGLEDKVKFLGYQENPFKYISRSDCFVFPSDFEGFPNVLIEALACGIAVISTDCLSGPRELLAPETDFMMQNTESLEFAEFGVLVPVGNKDILTAAMLKVRDDDSLRISLSSKAETRAADFDSKIVVEDLRKIMLSVCANS